MFTGIIEELGIVRRLERGPSSARLEIAAETVTRELQVGDSVAVNGVCLTVTSFGPRHFTADVMAETLARTNLGQLQPGDRVNLERALRLSNRLGGHLVTGHVDGTGEIRSRVRVDIAQMVTISAPPGVLRYVIPRGSIAVDGISLTVTEVGSDYFCVSLIPHTAKMTTLGYKQVGDTVNLEADIIGKYVEKFFAAWQQGENRGTASTTSAGTPQLSRLTVAFLREHGFA